MSRLADLLRRYAHLQRPLSLRHLEDVLRQEKFTGPVTYHYQDGVPKRIEAGKPLTVEILPTDTERDLTTAKG